ncbi:MAG: GH3 auxin-responsive promoter family protein [Planctomycetes bacterium]|nr:GH3 auxin-responsive promoter family protein [Planctomycetota bacterium]
MSLARLLLRPAARLAGLHARAQLRAYLRAFHRGRDAQDALLAGLLARGAATRFGRDHRLDRVRTYADFVDAVPVGDHAARAAYLESVYAGDVEALFPRGERIVLFALTSGTTGTPKRIPITAAALDAYRRGWNAFGYRMLSDHPAAWLRKILQISSAGIEYRSPAGVPCGSISGLLAASQKRIVRRMYVGGPAAAIADPAARLYTLARLAIGQDVALISTANPSSVLQLLTTAETHLEALLRDLADGTLTPPGPVEPAVGRRLALRRQPRQARAIERRLAADGGVVSTKSFWELALLAHWTGGTLGLYLPELRRRAPGVPIRDIGLLASEGRLSLPLEDETSAGVADVLGAFLEFIPAAQAADERPTVLRTHEVEVGAEYLVVLTNRSGLWRYSIGDRVRVTGFLGDTPLIAFLSKDAHTANLTGEKLTEHQLVAAMAAVSRRLAVPIDRFLAQPCFAATPYYRITAEPPAAADPRLAELLDGELGRLNIEYASKRRSGRLAAPRILPVAPGTFDLRQRALLAARRGRDEQYKHQYLLTDVLTEEAGGSGV